MRILSIDWDYFFPDINNYDWCANEENSLFYEAIWFCRCYSHNLVTKKEALFEYIPTIPENFWSIVKNRPKLYLADSHSQIWHLISQLSGCIVDSFDAHHDYGYKNKPDVVDCSNWGQHGLRLCDISELNLYYPGWREKYKESKGIIGPTNTHYGLPGPNNYDAVFVCRSSCWTPPWHDVSFKRFISRSNLDNNLMDQKVWNRRSLTMREAKKIRLIDKARIEQLMKANHV